MKTISIHGKNYVPVSERIKEAGDNLIEVHTEVLQHEPVVVVKATIVIKDKGTFSGISSANPNKVIEATNPYEVAETSALGRALGFAGYGIDEGIASADEMTKYPEDNYGDAEATEALSKTTYPASQKQIDFIDKLEAEKGVAHMKITNKNEASKRIETLMALPAKILKDVNESFARSEEENPEEVVVEPNDIPF